MRASIVRKKGRAMEFEDLTPEQQEKAKACTTVDELVALAKEEGIELTDEELEAMAGGEWNTFHCGETCGGVHFF